MGSWKIFLGASPRTPVFCSLHLCFFSAPQYEIHSNSHRKFFQATAKSNVLSTFCSLSVFLMAFFSSNLWSIYASMLFYVSGDHHHFSYGKGSSKLQIFTLPHTDPARLFCRKSLRCATNKSTKNLGCASAILSILARVHFIHLGRKISGVETWLFRWQIAASFLWFLALWRLNICLPWLEDEIVLNIMAVSFDNTHIYFIRS